MRLLLLSALALPALLACSSTTETHDSVRIVAADPSIRTPLLAAMKGLAGTWEVEGEMGPGSFGFSVTSMGSAVREVMFVGLPHEMTNLYTLDGNTLHMTHYCGAGNQPHMRATEVADGRIEFAPAGVSDRKASDTTYMGRMTLVIVDEDHVEEHWHGVGEGAHDTVIRLRRTGG